MSKQHFKIKNGARIVGVTAYPADAEEGDIVLRSDLTPPRLSVYRNGAWADLHDSAYLDFNSANDTATGSNATLSAIGNSPFVRLTNASLVSVDMIPAGNDGQIIVLANTTGTLITLNNDTGATAANRIITGTLKPLKMKNGGTVILMYDSTSSRWRTIGGGGGDESTTTELLERIKDRLIDAPFEWAEPNIFLTDESNKVSSATASYDIANGVYKYTSAGQNITSIQSLDNEFLTEEKDVTSVELMAFWNQGAIDSNATYEVSRNGGTNWSTLGMSRVGTTTDTFRGIYNFPPDTSYSVLHEHALANATAYRELTSLSGVLGGELKLTASDGATDDLFGKSVTISSDGNTIIVGSQRDDVGANIDQGSVYVFTKSGGVWSQTQKLTASDGAAGDFFGTSVATSSDGSTIIVGSQSDDVGANIDQGSAYVFTKSGGVWSQTQKLTASDGAASDEFGISVAISSDGNTIVVGSGGNDVGANLNQGSAYVFTKSGGVWSQTQKLTASDGAASDFFGISVAISSDSNTIVVGSWGDDVGANLNQGSAYVFTKSGGVWSETQKLTASDGAAVDIFGTSVAISSDGNTIIVGSQSDDVGANSNQGSAYVFTKSGGVWSETQKLTASDGAASDEFGTSVAISSDGSTIIVGSQSDDVGANSNQGSAYVFTKSGGVWSETQKLTASDGAAVDRFGYSVSISSDGNTIVVGSWLDNVGANSDQGSAYIYSIQNLLSTGQKFTVATNTAEVVQRPILYLNKVQTAGTLSGTVYMQLVKDNGSGLPSTNTLDIVVQAQVLCSDLAIGDNAITLSWGTTPISAGTYHLVIATDAAYKASYAAGVRSVRARVDASAPIGTFGLGEYNGVAWSTNANQTLIHRIEGRPLDLRVRITSSASNVELKGYGILYGRQQQVTTGLKNREVQTFDGTLDNYNEFTLSNFLPDADLLKIYHVETGQVYVRATNSFYLDGHKVIFPVDTFDGLSTVTLVFDQPEGAAFDNAEENSALLAANFLGSTDAAVDRSQPGRGIFLRRPDGTLRELTIDNSDQIAIYSV